MLGCDQVADDMASVSKEQMRRRGEAKAHETRLNTGICGPTVHFIHKDPGLLSPCRTSGNQGGCVGESCLTPETLEKKLQIRREKVTNGNEAKKALAVNYPNLRRQICKLQYILGIIF